MCANKRNGTRVVGAIRNHITAAYLRWMQIDAGCSTGPVARRIDWRTMMNCYFNVVKSKMASSPYPAAEDDRAFLTEEGFRPIFFLCVAASARVHLSRKGACMWQKLHAVLKVVSVILES